MVENYILYGVKDGRKFYICNTSPVIWTSDPNQVKNYINRYGAEYDVLRDYENYKCVSKLIESGSLDNLYVALAINSVEQWSVKIL